MDGGRQRLDGGTRKQAGGMNKLDEGTHKLDNSLFAEYYEVFVIHGSTSRTIEADVSGFLSGVMAQTKPNQALVTVTSEPYRNQHGSTRNQSGTTRN